MKFLLRVYFLITVGTSLLSLGQTPLRAAEITYHSQLELLDFKPPGRVVLLSDGKFGCISKGRYLTSGDEGKTWEEIAEIPRGDGPAVDGGIPIETRDGAVVFIYRDMANYHLERTDNNMPKPGANLDIWSVRSADGGKTWDAPHLLQDGYCGATIDAICTRDNKIVVPLQDIRFEPPRQVTVVYFSEDNGAIWKTSADLDIGGYGLEDGAFEGTVTERQDGSLLLYMRTSRDRIWWSESNDGLEWRLTTPTDIKASNSPAFLLTLKSGRLALVWNQLYPEGKSDWPRRTKTRYAERPDNNFREELSLAFSEDGGETWTAPVVIARQPGTRLGYSYMLERQQGEIWLHLRGQWLSFREEDFDLTPPAPSP